MARRRLFVAAELDDAARDACARVAERLRAARWPGRWVPPENYHLTVAFLGGVEEERIADVTAALSAAAPVLPALRVPLDAVGAFPSARRPRVAWVGPARPVEAFAALCGAVRGALAELGFAFEPHADAHVTLARADGRTALPPVTPPDCPPLEIGSLTLYESLTEPTGPRYLARERFTLRR